MLKLYLGALTICISIGVAGQEVLWQKNIKTSSQNFLNQITTTIDQQYLITGSSIQTKNQTLPTNRKQQNNGYDYHLMKLNRQGELIWEKYFAGQDHDYLSASVSTQEGGYLIAGTSYSGKGQDKKDDSKGGSDFWLVRLSEIGDELWQKTLGTPADEEARSIIQTTDLGFFVAGNVKNSSKGYGSKDVWIIKLDSNGKELYQLILGGKGLDEVEKMIPTRDGGVLVGIYSRSHKVNMINKHSAINNENTISATINPLFVPKQSENFGEGDYWIVKLDRNGKIEWEKNYGGSGDDHIRTLALTSAGYIIGANQGLIYQVIKQ